MLIRFLTTDHEDRIEHFQSLEASYHENKLRLQLNGHLVDADTFDSTVDRLQTEHGIIDVRTENAFTATAKQLERSR